MGQTLTHGVYLPDEGERNCYSGLAANWQILDGSVGTIAAHTATLSGKAPLVHTHTKSDITDFPVYGTTAGTICEGNDSRLSDARTPVAHTHGKADITDLFNSANTWTGDNTFSGSNSFNSGLTINNAALISAVLQNAVKGNVSTTGDFAIFIKDKVNGNAATSLLAVYRGGQDSGGSYAQINIDTKGNDNNRYNNGIFFRINPADNSNNAVFIPQRDKTIDLGTSTNKWKTLNGVNPGALSLPDITRYTDLTSNIPSASLDGTTSIDLSSYITSNGWLSIVVPDTNTDDFVFVQVIGNLSNRYFMSGAKGNGFISLMMPINRAGDVLAQIKASSVTFCRFYQCLGNV